MSSLNYTNVTETLHPQSTYWHYIFDEISDQRTKTWFLMENPVTILSIIASYIYVVKILGPNIMKNRKAFDLKNILIVYNFLQVLLSTYIVYESVDGYWLDRKAGPFCDMSYDLSPRSMRVCRGFYIYFLAKISEMLDTIFFVLRKKNNQITFLHVYHHGSMIALSWIGVKYIPGGAGVFVGSLNSSIHIIMYTYYLLAALGPAIQKYLWWKKWITSLQLIQFVLIGMYMIGTVFTNCHFPKGVAIFGIIHASTFFFLFNQFYQKSYNGKQKKVA